MSAMSALMPAIRNIRHSAHSGCGHISQRIFPTLVTDTMIHPRSPVPNTHAHTHTHATEPVVFTRWGSRSCPSNNTLYSGSMVSTSLWQKGGGTNHLCMHPHLQSPPVYDDERQVWSNLLHRSVYDEPPNEAAERYNGGEAACAVCEDTTATAVYVQWGRVNCSHGHRTQYSGLVMGGHKNLFPSENVCVDRTRELRVSETGDSVIVASSKSRLYLSEVQHGSHENSSQTACAVCSPVTAGRVFVSWGARTCASGTKLYDGFVAGKHRSHKGGGVNFLCMHPQPQKLPGQSNQKVRNPLCGVRYGVARGNGTDAACAVCEDDSATAPVYVQWGRQRCSNGHTTVSAGSAMASNAAVGHQAAQTTCIDRQQAAVSGTSVSSGAGRLYYTDMAAGAADEGAYPPGNAVTCALCSPNNTQGEREKKWVRE